MMRLSHSATHIPLSFIGKRTSRKDVDSALLSGAEISMNGA
jgi:hypothetical protein